MKTNKGLKIALITVSSIAFLLLVYLIVILCIHFFDSYKPINEEEFYEAVGDNLNIPVIEINTAGSDPQDKEIYKTCSFQLSNAQDPNHNIKLPIKQNPTDIGGIGIRLRGNYSKKAPEKSYRIRFNEQTSLLGMEANRSWVLLADYYDQSNIRNYTAYTLASYFDNLDFTPTPNHVALIMNGEFKGLYLLCEQIDEENGRCDIEEDIFALSGDYPFLVCIDSGNKSGLVKDRDYFEIEGYYPVEIKYPDYDERPEKNDPVFNYTKEYMTAVIESLKSGKAVNVSFSDTPLAFEDLVDVDSLVDYYLVNEIMFNCDSASKSIYAYKEAGGKLKFGPVWDFDWSLAYEFELPYETSEIETASQIHIGERSPLFRHFLKYEKYKTMVAKRFMEKKDCLTEVSNFLRDYKAKIDSVAILDAKQCYGENSEFEYDMQYDYVRLYLLDRQKFLEEYFKQFL